MYTNHCSNPTLKKPWQNGLLIVFYRKKYEKIHNIAEFDAKRKTVLRSNKFSREMDTHTHTCTHTPARAHTHDRV